MSELEKQEIKDSGHRREFETGAQRDRAMGKGLPTLVSDVIIHLQNKDMWYAATSRHYPQIIDHIGVAISLIYTYMWTRDLFHLNMCMCHIMVALEKQAIVQEHPEMTDEGVRVEVARYLSNFKVYMPRAIRRLSIHLEKGAAKYSARNWEKGMPLEEYLNSLLRHLFACYEGKEDEDHYAASAFNVMAFLHTHKYMKMGYLPESLDMEPHHYTKNQNGPDKVPAM